MQVPALDKGDIEESRAEQRKEQRWNQGSTTNGASLPHGRRCCPGVVLSPRRVLRRGRPPDPPAGDGGAAAHLRGGLHPAVRGLKPQAPRRREAGSHLPRRENRLRVRVAGRVPPRLLQRQHQAALRPRRRRRRRLLHVERGRVREDARRAGLRVPGEREGQGVEGADQRVRRRQHGGRPGGEVRPLVRPHAGLPPLRHPMDQSHHPVLHRRDTDQGGGAQRADGGAVPVQAHVGVRHHLGRLQLGHLWRPLQGGLQVRALRRPVHRPPAPAGAGPQRRRDDVAGAAGGDGEGPCEVHDVRVLLRPCAVPGAAAGVQGGRGGGDVPAVGRGEVVGPAQAR